MDEVPGLESSIFEVDL